MADTEIRHHEIFEKDTVVVGDCNDVMDGLPQRLFDLTVTSPPYYNARPEYASWPSYEVYLDWCADWLAGVYRVTKRGGRLAVNVPAGYDKNPWLPISIDVTKIIQDVGFILRGQVIWDKAQQNAGQTAWGSWMSASCPHLRERHEVIIFASRGRHEKGHKGESDISRDEFLLWTQSVWRFNAASGTPHPAPFPVELPLRCIKLFTYIGDLVFDPFMGWGTTAIACLETGRHYFGCDHKSEYVHDLALPRIERWRCKHSQQQFAWDEDSLNVDPRPFEYLAVTRGQQRVIDILNWIAKLELGERGILNEIVDYLVKHPNQHKPFQELIRRHS